VGISISKCVSLVNALAKLHNFCIDCFEEAPPRNPVDHYTLVTNPSGFVNLEVQENSENVALPSQLMGGGHHWDDIDRTFRRNQNLETLPRQRLLEQVANSHLVRPRPIEP
jgi:hypothetical protein